MKLILLLIALCFFSSARAQTVSEENILKMNIGKTVGNIEGDLAESCDLEIDQVNPPGDITTSFGLYANVIFAIFPNDPSGFWELDQLRQNLVYYEDILKRDFVTLSFDPQTLKIKAFTTYHDFGRVTGSTCTIVK